MKNFPLRQNFELKINIKRNVLFFKKTKTILLKYKEASVAEIIEFIQSEKQIIEFFTEFILKNSNANNKDLGQILLNFDKIWDKLSNTFLRGLNHKDNNKNNIIDNNSNSGSFNAYITLLSEKLNLDPITLINNYTISQLNYLTEGIIYNINEQSEKGKQENRLNNTKKQRESLNDVDAKKIRDFIYSD